MTTTRRGLAGGGDDDEGLRLNSGFLYKQPLRLAKKKKELVRIDWHNYQGAWITKRTPLIRHFVLSNSMELVADRAHWLTDCCLHNHTRGSPVTVCAVVGPFSRVNYPLQACFLLLVSGYQLVPKLDGQSGSQWLIRANWGAHQLIRKPSTKSIEARHRSLLVVCLQSVRLR